MLQLKFNHAQHEIHKLLEKSAFRTHIHDQH
jgi:hypothetical protein